jgi:hypothetical protein
MKIFTANAFARRGGGESETKRIVYQAAPGEKVKIKGSEVIKNWVKVRNNVWTVTRLLHRNSTRAESKLK